MASARELAELLIGGSLKIAQKVDGMPTGVKPGYRAGLKGTVLPNGKLLYASDTAAGGGSDPLLCKYGVNTGFTLTSGNTKRVDFNYQYDDFGPYVTTGASWKFVAPANGYYTWTPKLYLEIQGDPSGGNAVWINHVNVTTGVHTIIWQRNANDLPAAACNVFMGFPFTDYCDANDETYIELENGLGVNIVISGSSSGRKINQVTIEKVKAI